MMANNKLKPCPWCGNTPDASNPGTFQLTDGVKYGAVQCCGAGPDVRTDYRDFPHWKDAAIESWNDRTAPAQGALTDAEILDALASITHEPPKRLPPGWLKFARAIEQRVRGQVSDAADAWQPIATAPCFGPILLWWRTCKTPHIGEWTCDESTEREGWRCHGDQCLPINQEDCTHWQPLPAPPAIQAQAGDAQSGADHG